MKFNINPKEFELWINDVLPILKKTRKDWNMLDTAQIKLDPFGLHLLATDKVIVVDTCLQVELSENIIDVKLPEYGVLTLESMLLLKANAKTVQALKVEDDKLQLFADQFDGSTPFLEVPISEEGRDGHFTSVQSIMEATRNKEPDVGKEHVAFKVDLIKHIKGVGIEPHSAGLAIAGFLHRPAPVPVTGLIMPYRIKEN